MSSNNRISIKGKFLNINEMYLRINDIHFVDVVKQGRSTFSRLCGVIGGFGIFFGLITMFFSRSAGGFMLLWSIALVVLKFILPRTYALRVGYGIGTTKAIVSSNKAALDDLCQRIHIGLTESIAEEKEL